MSVELGDQARTADYLNAARRFASARGGWESAARLLARATALYQTIEIEQVLLLSVSSADLRRNFTNYSSVGPCGRSEHGQDGPKPPVEP